MARAAVFLDRDGVLIQNVEGYVRSVEDLHWLPDVFPALRRLAQSDLSIVVITNQAGVGKGLMTKDDVANIHRHLTDTIAENGGRVDAIYVCLHAPSDCCQCRKPKPGLILAAAQELQLDLNRSFAIGDSVRDAVAAKSAGCESILVLTGHGTRQYEQYRASFGPQALVFADLYEAVSWLADRSSEQSKRERF